jgi:hypothetical protein
MFLSPAKPFLRRVKAFAKFYAAGEVFVVFSIFYKKTDEKKRITQQSLHTKSLFDQIIAEKNYNLKIFFFLLSILAQLVPNLHNSRFKNVRETLPTTN